MISEEYYHQPLHELWVQSWSGINALVTGMADGSLWGGTKNKQLMNATSAHEVEILFRSVCIKRYGDEVLA